MASSDSQIVKSQRLPDLENKRENHFSDRIRYECKLSQLFCRLHVLLSELTLTHVDINVPFRTKLHFMINYTVILRLFVFVFMFFLYEAVDKQLTTSKLCVLVSVSRRRGNKGRNAQRREKASGNVYVTFTCVY